MLNVKAMLGKGEGDSAGARIRVLQLINLNGDHFEESKLQCSQVA